MFTKKQEVLLIENGRNKGENEGEKVKERAGGQWVTVKTLALVLNRIGILERCYLMYMLMGSLWLLCGEGVY